jgi:hypothetical protein
VACSNLSYATMSQGSLKPQKPADSTQAWFWESSWQTREREADADLTAGRVIRHSSSDEFLTALDRRMKPAL